MSDVKKPLRDFMVPEVGNFYTLELAIAFAASSLGAMMSHTQEQRPQPEEPLFGERREAYLAAVRNVVSQAKALAKAGQDILDHMEGR